MVLFRFRKESLSNEAPGQTVVIPAWWRSVLAVNLSDVPSSPQCSSGSSPLWTVTPCISLPTCMQTQNLNNRSVLPKNIKIDFLTIACCKCTKPHTSFSVQAPSPVEPVWVGGRHFLWGWAWISLLVPPGRTLPQRPGLSPRAWIWDNETEVNYNVTTGMSENLWVNNRHWN